jgi:hypothetical protein
MRRSHAHPLQQPWPYPKPPPAAAEPREGAAAPVRDGEPQGEGAGRMDCSAGVLLSTAGTSSSLTGGPCWPSDKALAPTLRSCPRTHLQPVLVGGAVAHERRQRCARALRHGRCLHAARQPGHSAAAAVAAGDALAIVSAGPEATGRCCRRLRDDGRGINGHAPNQRDAAQVTHVILRERKAPKRCLTARRMPAARSQHPFAVIHNKPGTQTGATKTRHGRLLCAALPRTWLALLRAAHAAMRDISDGSSAARASLRPASAGAPARVGRGATEAVASRRRSTATWGAGHGAGSKRRVERTRV